MKIKKIPWMQLFVSATFLFITGAILLLFAFIENYSRFRVVNLFWKGEIFYTILLYVTGGSFILAVVTFLIAKKVKKTKLK